ALHEPPLPGQVVKQHDPSVFLSRGRRQQPVHCPFLHHAQLVGDKTSPYRRIRRQTQRDAGALFHVPPDAFQKTVHHVRPLPSHCHAVTMTAGRTAIMNGISFRSASDLAAPTGTAERADSASHAAAVQRRVTFRQVPFHKKWTSAMRPAAKTAFSKVWKAKAAPVQLPSAANHLASPPPMAPASCSANVTAKRTAHPAAEAAHPFQPPAAPCTTMPAAAAAMFQRFGIRREARSVAKAKA